MRSRRSPISGRGYCCDRVSSVLDFQLVDHASRSPAQNTKTTPARALRCPQVASREACDKLAPVCAGTNLSVERVRFCAKAQVGEPGTPFRSRLTFRPSKEVPFTRRSCEKLTSAFDSADDVTVPYAARGHRDGIAGDTWKFTVSCRPIA